MHSYNYKYETFFLLIVNLSQAGVPVDSRMVIKWWKKSTLTISQTWQHCSRRLIPEQRSTVTVVGLLCWMAHLLMAILQVKYQLDRRKQYILYPCIKPGTLLYCDTL